MKLVLLILFLILAPYLLGKGSLILYGWVSRPAINSVSASYVCGSILLLLFAGVSHLVTLFLSKDLSFAFHFYSFLLIGFLTLSYVGIIIEKLRTGMRIFQNSSEERTGTAAGTPFCRLQSWAAELTPFRIVLFLILLVLVLLQLILVAKGNEISISRDQMAETVQSFLAENGIYRVNPLTGLPYETGVPSRIKILCLPTFYAYFCDLFDINVRTLLWNVMPTFWLCICYFAFLFLGKVLYPQDSERRLLFFLFSLLLLFCSGSVLGQIGFGIFHAGYRATTLRLTVLIPMEFAALSDRKYLLALLPVIVESMITWTGFGVGLCFLVYILFLFAAFLQKKLAEKEADKEVAV